MKEEFLHKKLEERKALNALRQLRLPGSTVDFCSNDYLGIVKNKLLADQYTADQLHGSTGSRLLTGNYSLIEETEKLITSFHDAEAGLIFNSGYDANVGLLSAVAQRGDTIVYDRLCHASIRDGIRLSFAASVAFEHNDVEDLQKKITQASGNIFVVTESLFSMDGDLAPVEQLVNLCNTSGAQLIIDEAHATGIIGYRGEGLIQHLGLQSGCFARVHTFGKALGCHGAIILGSQMLRDYLINFCRPFIFSTALPAASVAAIKNAYECFPAMQEERLHIQRLADSFQQASVSHQRLVSRTAIQGIIIPGNQQVKDIAHKVQKKEIDVRPILYPTVAKGSERLRIVLHSFNTEEELENLIHAL